MVKINWDAVLWGLMLMTCTASVDTERPIPLKAKWILFVTALAQKQRPFNPIFSAPSDSEINHYNSKRESVK